MSVPRAVQRRGGADGDEAGCAHQILFVPVRMPDAPKRGLVIRARRQIEAHNGVDVAVALEAPQHPRPNAWPVAEPARLDRRMARCGFGSLGKSRQLGEVDADALPPLCAWAAAGAAALITGLLLFRLLGHAQQQTCIRFLAPQ